jgi:hypothetical protein
MLKDLNFKPLIFYYKMIKGVSLVSCLGRTNNGAFFVIRFSRRWQFVQWLCDLGISHPAFSPSLSKICRIWKPGFYIDG